MVEDPQNPRGGRLHRIGLCTEDAAAMLLGMNMAMETPTRKHGNAMGRPWEQPLPCFFQSRVLPQLRINAAMALQKSIPALKGDIVPLLQFKVWVHPHWHSGN